MRAIMFVLFGLNVIGIGACGFATGIDVDVVYYYGEDSLTYCEVYAGVQRSALVYMELADDSMFAQFSLVTTLGQNGTVYLSDTLDTYDRSLAGDFRTSGAYFPSIFRYLLRPGIYDVTVELIQDSAKTEEWTDLELLVPQITHDTGISGLALGAELAFDAEASQFTKNGVRFVPNPSAFYGSGLPMLYYYVECYGLDTTKSVDDSLIVKRRVLDGETGKDVKQPNIRKVAVSGSSIVIADGFPAYTLKTGTYFVDVEFEFSVEPPRSARKKFFVYRPEDIAYGGSLPDDRDFTSAIFRSDADILNTIDPDSALSLMQYLLTKQEMRRARDMDSVGKRRFLIDYWQKYKPDDSDAANRHFARVAEANRRYSFLNREGWKTDRGRVLILYGEPDYVDRRYAEAAGSDHEIWHYDKLEGGVLFIFVDQSGFGDLNLVHSTKRGEIYNPNALFVQQNQNPKSKLIDQSRGLRE